MNKGLTEHTGHGVPTIIKKYGKEVFEITDNYIKCRIPYNKNVLEMSRQSVGINVGINKTEKAVLEILISNTKKNGWGDDYRNRISGTLGGKTLC